MLRKPDEIELNGGTLADLLARSDVRLVVPPGHNLSLADLTGANLRGADLRKASLFWADLRKVDLREADLRGADLRGADLRGVDLAGAKGVIRVGTSSDGYEFYGVAWPNGPMVKAGCRWFTLEQAREHWETTRGGTELGKERLEMVDLIQKWFEGVKNEL